MNYFIVCENYKNTGVEKKITGQKKALQKIGNYKFIGFSEDRIFPRIFISPFKIILRLKNVEKIYYRYSSLNFLIHFFLVLFFKNKYYLEINTKNRDELKFSKKKSFKNKIKYLFNLIWEKPLYKNSYKIVTFTREIKNYINSIYKNNKTLIIENGYYENNVNYNDNINKRLIPPKAIRYKYKAIIASTFYPWAGVDLILDIIKNYKEIFLIIAGFGPENDKIAKKIKKERITNVFMVGRKTSSELKILYKNCDFGFGTFALDRKDMRMAKPLKVREYLINGLPVIYKYRESYPVSKMEFCFRYNGDKSELDKFINNIDKFDKNRIKKFARKKFDWEKIMRKVIDIS